MSQWADGGLSDDLRGRTLLPFAICGYQQSYLYAVQEQSYYSCVATSSAGGNAPEPGPIPWGTPGETRNIEFSLYIDRHE